MGNRKRLTRITIEQHEVKVTRRRPERVTAYCDRCGSIVTALVPEAAEVMQISQTEPGEIHFIDPAGNDRGLLCDGSIKEIEETTEERK